MQVCVPDDDFPEDNNPFRIRAEAGILLVNSRDVAELFEKEHKNVLRDIDGILAGSDLSAPEEPPFRLVLLPDAQSKERRSFDMTRDGFTFLITGWTGPKATSFKWRFIKAFNVMEAHIRSSPVQTARGMTQNEVISVIQASMKEIVAPLADCVGGQNRAIERVETHVEKIGERVAYLESEMRQRRRSISSATKRIHVLDTFTLGGRCPCCGEAEVVDVNGCQMPFTEHDHFYRNNRPEPPFTWLICKPCHHGFTTGRVTHADRSAEFSAYQNKRSRLPGRQATLFG